MSAYQGIKEWSDIVLKWVTIIAIPIGGWWAYHNYSITDTPEPSPLITVTADVVPYNDKFSLVVAHLHPKNIGKVPITLTGGKWGGDLFLDIKRLPKGLKASYVDNEKLPDLKEIPRQHFAMDAVNSYTMEPGAEYDEVFTFVVPRGDAYFIYGELDLPDPDHDPEPTEVDGSRIVSVPAK